jgi:predicted RNase H-like HicB family nuclease
MRTKLAMVCKKCDNGAYIAVCPDVKGCFTQADTLEDAIANLKALAEDLIENEMDEELKTYLKTPRERVFLEFEVDVN